jgi:pullulanase
LVRKGYRDGENVLYVEEDGAPHHESAWARRLPDALRWLLG